MAWMDSEVFRALLSAGIPEEKAINCAVALYEATGNCRASVATQNVHREIGIDRLAAETASLRLDIASLESDMRITRWMMAVNLLLTFIICLKVFSN